ncbi:MAG: molybdenum ABC transporter ATP-binding protein [Thermodesulfobacteriota bacterium]
MELEVELNKKIGDFSMEAKFSLSGDKHGVFGPSGSGKSTLMSLLAGLAEPDQGRIILDGQVLFDGQQKINRPPAQRRMGVVFQHSHLFPHLTVKKNLLYGWQRTKPADRRGSPGEVIEALELEPLLVRDVTTLSGGERQRVALGRTLLSCPRLILLDEPLTGLDQEMKLQIIPYLKTALAQFAIPFLFISHSLEEIRLLTDNVLLLGGSEVEQLAPEELARRHFLGNSRRGYANLLHLGEPTAHGDLWRYNWQGAQLILTEPGGQGDTIFELGAKDITLFKRHPEATSARNMLDCQVTDLWRDGNRVGVELAVAGGRLVSQIVPDSARELGVCKGAKIVAVIKASAFRKLY